MRTQNPPIFIVGAPRTGTHLLRYCLSKHPDIYVAPETGYFIRIHGNRNNPFWRLMPQQKFAQTVADRVLFDSGDPSMAEFIPFRQDLVSRVKSAERTPRSLGEAVFGFFAEVKGKTWWGEKTPAHAFYLGQILDTFPDARIVFMTRDPLNTVASFLASDLLPDSDYRALAYLLLARSALVKYKEVVHQVDYRDLTQRPRTILEAVARHVGAEFDQAMLRPGMRDSSYGDALMEFDEGIGIEKADKDKWRQVLSQRQEQLVKGIMGIGNAEPSWVEKAKVHLDVLRLMISTKKNRLGLASLTRRPSVS